MGVDLIRKINKKDAYGITSPLITNSDGSKMGKTASGAIWLNKNKISSLDFFNFGEMLMIMMYLNSYIYLLNFNQ